MKILVSGSTGLVGSTLIPFLIASGHEVVRLIRNRKDLSHDCLYWDPKGEIIPEQGFDAIIHLAGKNIATRWTPQIKEEILSSRVENTRRLSEIISKLSHPPKVFICASAIGIYGDRKEEVLTEKSELGSGFLAHVSKEWEAATESAKKRGVRCINARFGVILSSKGGALARMMLPFRFGLGAILGTGDQFMSWIALEDVIHALHHALLQEELEGAVNFTSPEPVTNREFSQKLAKALHRPLIFRIGERPLKWLLGEMAEEMLLSSAKVMPEKLVQSGYEFTYPILSSFFSNM